MRVYISPRGPNSFLFNNKLAKGLVHYLYLHSQLLDTPLPMSRIVLILSCAFLFSSCIELLQALEESQQQSQSQTQQSPQSPSTPQTFAEMDSNNDGRLSSTEAQGTYKTSFAKLDSNGDGYLTKAEAEGTASNRTDKRPSKI